MAVVILAPGREKSLLRRHPWIFSGAIASVKGSEPQLGETVEVRTQHGQFLAWGSWSGQSQIRVRAWSFIQNEKPSAELLRTRLARCIQSRSSCGFVMDGKQGFRLVNAESDGLPGCIIDCYGNIAVCQLLSAGWEIWRDELVNALRTLLPQCTAILERSDSDARLKEGLTERKDWLWGTPTTHVSIFENGLELSIDLWNGHKTGYYLDQRDARAAVAQYSKGKDVLNAFCYTGGFGLKALQGGAKSVVQMDVSADALEIAKKNTLQNQLAFDLVEWSVQDVFHELRKYRDRGRQFDLIVLDPPKFVDSQGHLEKAARGYKDINLLAFKLLKPHGLLFTFSCSGLMGPELFSKIVADAAVDVHRDCRIIARFGHPVDHPVATSFPEGLYLKGLLVEAD